MQLALVQDNKKDANAGKKKTAKHVPEVVQSAKFITAEKKEQEKAKK
jgi:hypothetical protein